jgi:voltage-gated potassium channel
MSIGKLVLFGCNPLGLEVARRLAAGARKFMIVDSDDSMFERAEQEGFHTMKVDYTDDDALRVVGIGDDVDTIFCMLPEDSDNVFLAISARTLDQGLRIVAVCRTPDAGAKLRAAGADKVIDPYEISGSRVHELIARPAVADILEHTVFGRHDLNIAEITIPPNSWLNQRRLSELKEKLRQNLLLLGVVDLELGNELIFGTRGINHKLDSGDVLVVIGARHQIEAFRADLNSTTPPPQPAA